MRIKTNFEGVKEVLNYWQTMPNIKRGFIDAAQVEFIKMALELNNKSCGRDILSCRNLRDFVCVFFSVKLQEVNLPRTDEDLLIDCLSAITAVIDEVIFTDGGEV